MFRRATPVLRVTSSAAAEAFYCRKLGFTRTFAYRLDPAKEDPCYMGVVREGAHLHLSSFPGDGVLGTHVQLLVEHLDDILEEYRKAGGLTLEGPRDQTWGNREFSVRDPDGNKLTFAQPTE